MTRITLSLVSHTNVGKTTLARTLLRRDVGEVLDHAHVTEVGEAHELIHTEEHELILWDTPGFGDSTRLARRLRAQEGGLTSFLLQAWDRARDRPLWCGQQAIRNIRDEADVVLYLVNASEQPEDAGYLAHELEILEWIGRPLIVLLNQTGATQDEEQLIAPWRRYMQGRACVREVLTLDAFSRSWLREVELFERLAVHLPADKRGPMKQLSRAWRERGEAIFGECIGALVDCVLRAARDRESLPRRMASKAEKAAAMEALAERHLRAKRELGEFLIEHHGLDGRPAAELEERLADFAFEGEEEWSWRRSALVGGAVSGALSGLAADLISHGLTFGGGLIAGGIAGALGGAGLARGMQFLGVQGEPAVGWSADFLEASLRECLATYLTIAHFGRGRGRFEGRESPLTWSRAVNRQWRASAGRSEFGWKRARGADESGVRELGSSLRERLTTLARELLESGPRASDQPASSEP